MTKQRPNFNRQWKLKSRPEGAIGSDDLELIESPIPVPGEGMVLVRNLYLSLDPTNRIWMSDMDQYMPPVGLGDVMRGGTLGVVEQSNIAAMPVGTIVVGGMTWEDYFVAPAEALQAIPRDLPVPLPAWLSVVGLTGVTAYFGTLNICKPKAGETFFVSAAAGAVGSVAGQIAKMQGARVVGSAGSDAKCKWLTDVLGFDAAINYKKGDLVNAVGSACPNGIDSYFENVGGEIADAVLTHMNKFARVALCGLISSYNAVDPVPGPYMYRNFLMKSASLKGFIVSDYMEQWGEAAGALAQWVLADKIKYKVDVNPGLENAPTVLERLFTGANDGKLLIQISDEAGEFL